MITILFMWYSFRLFVVSRKAFAFFNLNRMMHHADDRKPIRQMTSLSCARQDEDERSERVPGRVEEQIAAVGAGDFAGQAQPQPGAVHLPAAGFFGAIKPLGDM